MIQMMKGEYVLKEEGPHLTNAHFTITADLRGQIDPQR